MQATLDRLPPQNIEAEQSVLGAMLLEKMAISKVAEILQAEDFYKDIHKTIFTAMMELNQKNEAVDLITLVEILKKNNKLDEVGGLSYISFLANAVPTAANIEHHARIVAEKGVLRQLINAATQIAANGYNANDNLEDIVDQAEKSILEISTRHAGGDFTPIKAILIDAFTRITKLQETGAAITGVPTGFKDLDTMTAGLQPSDLILIAARPSMGKTALVLNIAQHAAIREKKSVAFFSLEMSKEQLVQRMLCCEAPVDSQKLRIGSLEQNDWSNLINAADKLNAAHIYIDDTPGITVMQMRSKARRLKAEHGLDLLIIDYLQLMQGGTGSNRSENRQQEISEISRSLKALARELSIPVIALSQLSRSVESRQVKRPMLSDLRESGSLEQDADIVAFLYREDYYDKETENKDITEIIVAKHRNGPVDTVNLLFQKHFTRFVNIARNYE